MIAAKCGRSGGCGIRRYYIYADTAKGHDVIDDLFQCPSRASG
jgi:hypothetical protein